MQHKLMEQAPEGVEVSFPRKDVVKLIIRWKKPLAFLLYGTLTVMLFLGGGMIFFLMGGGAAGVLIVKVIVLLLFLLLANLTQKKAQMRLNGYAEVLLTPREIQHQLYSGKKEQGEKNQVRWRNMEVFMPKASTAKEISITGSQDPRGQLDKHLNWEQLEVLRNWMTQHYRFFYAYYTPPQIQYIEQWTEVQYQHYQENPQVDELEEDYFFKKIKELEIDLSQHLIDDEK
ncbi:MAG: hypothetical protein ACRBFS_25795 [Aureispira sp.]